MTSNEIRRIFLEYFQKLDHSYIKSAPIVLKDDPTLMFTNAGMNQFKDYFLGQQDDSLKRAVNSQKCLRVSGKHNDLEEVGVDTYHHTMFEMLGNWSFGDYFKADAIKWAWELLINHYKLPEDRIYVTVFGGDQQDKLDKDQEAYGIWKQYISEERILWCDKKDNFWEMGATGPCGPCSEIHIDLRNDAERKQSDGKSLVNADHPLVIEIWNLVFMEFNRNADNSLKNLPAKHVDTGMGFERLCMALQGKTSNYDTDVFSELISKVERLSGKKYGKDQQTDIAIRVVVDHIRAVTFAIADGQLPSNTGAGYVIRRILRRAVRYGYTYLGMQEAFINQLVPVLASYFKDIFDEVIKQQDFIQQAVLQEENAFIHTLGSGLKRLQLIEEELKESGKTTITGTAAFELYDTYGFPFDLTQLIAKEKGLKVDEKGFQQEMAQQKTRSRAAAETSTGDWIVINDSKKTSFIGYDQLEAEVKIAKYRTVEAKKKALYQIVLDQTPFYAESGGQVGDTGQLSAGIEVINVIDTVKENELFIHITDKLPKDPKAVFSAKVNPKKRATTANNHSATHLLHAALRQVLGNHVEQKGSLVAPDYLRFDFSHFSKIEEEQLREIENIVNERIRADIAKGEDRDMPIEQAKAKGAMALFGEKYGNQVRVISFDEDYSVELCGGTHVDRTGEIGLFKITSEGSISSGVRRIEAVTGEKALKYVNGYIDTLESIYDLTKNKKNVLVSIENLMKENERLKKELEKMEHKQAAQLKDDMLNEVEKFDGINFIGKKVEANSPEMLKTLAFNLNKQVDNLFLILGAEINGKANLTLMIDKGLAEKTGLNAGKIIREVAQEIKGGGGGQAFFATAGGKNPAGLDKAIEKAKAIVAEK